MLPEAPPTRVLWDGYVNNEQLLRVVSNTARASWPMLQYDPRLPRERLPWMCWQWVRQFTQYVPERGTQQVRTPWAFVRERVGDCKSTAVFIGAMCRAAGLPVKLRFVVLPNELHFSHVFPIVNGVPFDPLLRFGDACVALRCHDVAL